MRTALVRTGKFRPETLEKADPAPDIVVSSLAHFPALLEPLLASPFWLFHDPDLAYRLTQARQMVRQYPWLYRRKGLLGWEERH